MPKIDEPTNGKVANPAVVQALARGAFAEADGQRAGEQLALFAAYKAALISMGVREHDIAAAMLVGLHRDV